MSPGAARRAKFLRAKFQVDLVGRKGPPALRFLSPGLIPAVHPIHRLNFLTIVSLSMSFPPHPSEMVLTRGDELANSFGFQDDNVRNQVEHLMTLLANHRRYANSMPALTLA